VSVINKMLRDLDHPQLVAVAASAPQAKLSSLMYGTASVGAGFRERALPFKNRLWLGFAILGAAAIVTYFGFWSPQGLHPKFPEVAPVTASAPISKPIIPAQPVVVQPVEAPVVTAEPAPALVAGAGLTMDTRIDYLSLQKITPVPSAPVTPLATIAPKASLTLANMANVANAAMAHDTKTDLDAGEKAVARRDAVLAAVPARTLNPRKDEAQLANEAPTAPAASTAPVRREVSALEMAGQAQRLWNDGSRDAAIGLLKDALAVVEGAAGIDLAGPALAGWIPVVRELARMELAEGQTSQVLDLLRRLEPALSGHADLWAVRANAAQRLGAHQEATQAYQRALALRPSEPRWMLGAAVSMAANGQTADALELAQKARAAGVVSREVVAYLRQQGVPLPD
jgi:Flp pilus assembly protein TadD